MPKKIISTDKAPAAIGPYSQAVKAGNLLFTSGQIPINPATGDIISGDVEEQAEQVMNNLKEVLAAAGADFSNVIKTTVFIKSMDDFAKINRVYSEYFQGDFPARSCVEAARLPKNVLVEIEAVVLLE